MSRKQFPPEEWGEITDKQAEFLFAYQGLGSLTAAAKQVGIGRRQHHRWMNTCPDYVREFGVSREIALAHLEEEALRRAVRGVQSLKFYKGEIIKIQATTSDGRPMYYEQTRQPVMIPYVEHKYSDSLLMFMMKSMDPDRFRDNNGITIVNGQTGDQQVDQQQLAATVTRLHADPDYVDYLRRKSLGSKTTAQIGEGN